VSDSGEQPHCFIGLNAGEHSAPRQHSNIGKIPERCLHHRFQGSKLRDKATEGEKIGVKGIVRSAFDALEYLAGCSHVILPPWAPNRSLKSQKSSWSPMPGIVSSGSSR